MTLVVSENDIVDEIVVQDRTTLFRICFDPLHTLLTTSSIFEYKISYFLLQEKTWFQKYCFEKIIKYPYSRVQIEILQNLERIELKLSAGILFQLKNEIWLQQLNFNKIMDINPNFLI